MRLNVLAIAVVLGGLILAAIGLIYPRTIGMGPGDDEAGGNASVVECPETSTAAIDAAQPGVPGTEVGDAAAEAEAGLATSGVVENPAAAGENTAVPEPGSAGGEGRSPSLVHSGSSAHQPGSATGQSGSQAAATECLPPDARAGG